MGGTEGARGGREGGSDDVRQRGSGSGGKVEGGLIIVFFIQSEPYIGITTGTERARKGRNEAWTERGKERRD